MFAIITGIIQSLSSAIVCSNGSVQKVRIADLNGSEIIFGKRDNGVFVSREYISRWRALNLLRV